MAQKKPVALITGANQGIGLQIAKELVKHGFAVLVDSRNLERGQAAAKEVGPDGIAVQLDVTDHASMDAAADRIRSEFGQLDVLVNNATISNTTKLPSQTVEQYSNSNPPSSMLLTEVRAIWGRSGRPTCSAFWRYTSNAAPPTQARATRIVNVSSGAGSLGRNADPGFAYRRIFGVGYSAFKTAMTLAMATELEATGIKVNACSPDFIRTNLNNYEGTGTVEEGAREPVRLALLGSDGPTGTFTRWESQTSGNCLKSVNNTTLICAAMICAAI